MLTLKKVYPNFEEGAYGTVFFSPEGYATKVFKHRNDVHYSHTKNVFESELSAYNIAATNNELLKYIPKFFGLVTVDQIIDGEGNDITKQYEINYAYKMQKIEGTFLKYNLRSTPLGKLFYDSGIKHLSDTSVIFNEQKNIICVIDFAVSEYELEFTDN